MAKTYSFPCGCSFPVLSEDVPEGSLPLLDFDIENIRQDCPAVFDLLATGKLKGVFQLESGLGKRWTKRLKPTRVEHLAALSAVLRPGCLNVLDAEGVSMTEHYCRRKNNEEPVAPYHPAVDAILSETYGNLVYQEQIIALCMKIAGFSESGADDVRKGCAKKQPEILSRYRVLFVEGCVKTGIVSREQAEEIYGWILSSSSYSFNLSHATSYGITGYDTAYLKAHFPLQFFASWFANSHHESKTLEEIASLVQDARHFNIPVEPPDLRYLNKNFIIKDGESILFGLMNIKGVAGASITKLKASIEAYPKRLDEVRWYEFLTKIAPSIPSGIVEKLAQVGALRCLNVARARAVAELKAWKELTDTETKWLDTRSEPFPDLVTALKALALPRERKQEKVSVRVPKKGKEEEVAGLELEFADIERCISRLQEDQETNPGMDTSLQLEELTHFATKNRETYVTLTKKKKVDAEPQTGPFGGCFSDAREQVVRTLAHLLENPPTPLVDSPHQIAWNEEQLLGVALSCSRIESCDQSEVNCTCKEFAEGRDGYLVLGVEVVNFVETVTKRGSNPGQKMARMQLSDGTCQIDAVIFPEKYEKYAGVLMDGATIIVNGERDRRGEGSLIINRVMTATMLGK